MWSTGCVVFWTLWGSGFLCWIRKEFLLLTCFHPLPIHRHTLRKLSPSLQLSPAPHKQGHLLLPLLSVKTFFFSLVLLLRVVNWTAACPRFTALRITKFCQYELLWGGMNASCTGPVIRTRSRSFARNLPKKLSDLQSYKSKENKMKVRKRFIFSVLVYRTYFC